MGIFSRAELLLFDLDGTVYVGDKLIDGALKTVKAARAADKRVCFLTNNSSKGRRAYLEKLNGLGLDVRDAELYTSAQATYEYLAREHSDKRIYLVATDDVKEDFIEHGVKIAKRGEKPDAVVLAFDTGLTYEKLDRACEYISRGAFYAATHADLNCPRPISPMPDVGSFIELIKAATGKAPDIICGKPYKVAAEGIMKKYRLPADKIAMIGDRLYTDIRFGNLFGFFSVLVLTGETDKGMLKGSEDKPDLILDSVADMYFD